MIIIKIIGTHILFQDSSSNYMQWTTIDGLQLKREGILKEHPDLKGLPDKELRLEAVERFKQHIKALGGELQIRDYIQTELEKSGYILKSYQREGFRKVSVR